MIRKLDTIQKQENLNTVFAVDEKGNGNANHEYLVEGVLYNANGVVKKFGETIKFQNGARHIVGSTHGVLDTDLLEIVRDRLIGFQSGAFASKYNEEALYHVEKALEFMNERVMERASRGVLGTHNK